jgi:crotonobetainyl-CoA:carnitine CoA-transferase CaiB-like acyl-CoA transferase
VPSGPLDGMRVLDIGMLAAGPWAATYLADLGADVIKVEHPVHGDPSRVYGVEVDDRNIFWKNLGRNKRCVTLDMSKPGGQALLLRLVAEADVLIENFRAGTLDRWNLGWDQLRQANPNLVMVRTSGFGQDGPYSTLPGFGTLAESMSGYAHVTGDPDGPPQLPQFPLADGLAAVMGALAALAGAYRVAVGGTGQWVDNTLYEPLMRLLEQTIAEYSASGNVRRRSGNRLADVSPRGAYETSEPDRWVAISGSTPPTARRILLAIERDDLADDPRLSTNAGRLAHADLIDAALRDWIGRHTLAEALRRFHDCDAPIAPIYNAADIVVDPHFRHRKSLVEVEDDDFGMLTMPAVIPRFSNTPGRIRFAGRKLGEDNTEVYGGLLGLSDDEMDALRSKGVI